MQNEVVPYNNIQPNPWNPNAMNERQYQAELESICQFGFIDPVTVRDVLDNPEQREIIDGEHRWKAFGDVREKWLGGTLPDTLTITEEAEPNLLPFLEANQMPVVNLGAISDVSAKKLTVVLNETRGRANTVDLAVLLAQIATETTPEGLRAGLPYGSQELDDLLKLAEFDWNSLPQPTGDGGHGEVQGSDEPFVTITAALPQSAYTVWLLAVERVKAKLAADNHSLNPDEKISNGQVLELISADYIAGV